MDGGPCSVGVESTIIDLTCRPPRLLRPGGVTLESLRSVLGEVEVDPAVTRLMGPGEQPKAPGMKYRHYAPQASLTIVEGKAEDTIAYINTQCAKLKAEGKGAGVIATDETRGMYQAAVVKSIGTRRDEEGIARHLFGILREFDEEKVDAIFSESFDTPKMGQAIMNRLLKAAGHHIIRL